MYTMALISLVLKPIWLHVQTCFYHSLPDLLTTRMKLHLRATTCNLSGHDCIVVSFASTYAISECLSPCNQWMPITMQSVNAYHHAISECLSPLLISIVSLHTNIVSASVSIVNIVCYSKLPPTKNCIPHWNFSTIFAFQALHTWHRKLLPDL